MSETYTSPGLVGSTVQRATVGEAATGTHGQEFMRDDITKLADKTRFLDDAGFPNVSKIMFPATQVPSAGANDLDDYEEGDWTPTIAFGGAAVGMTFATAPAGKYTKVGRLVTLTMFFQFSAKGSSVGACLISGLPFVIQNLPGAYAACAVRTTDVSYSGMLQALVPINTSTIRPEQTTTGGVTTQLADTNFANTSSVMFQVSYIT